MSVEANNMKNIKNTSKMAQGRVKVKSFYSKHFPTDRRTYNLRVPFVGLILSILSLHITTLFLIDDYFRHGHNELIRYCYVFAAAGVGYELFYGLNIGDRKQLTPWILLKIIEICLTIIAFIYGCVMIRWLDEAVAQLIYASIVIILNCVTTYIVTSKSWRQFRGKPPKTAVDDNIYDNYDNV